MPDSCDCINIKVNVSLKEPKLNGKLDPKCETILCSDGEDYKRGYEEGHAQGLLDGHADGYDKGYSQGFADGTKEEQEKSITITENGTTEILPDENKVLSKVKVEVDVESGGGGIDLMSYISTAQMSLDLGGITEDLVFHLERATSIASMFSGVGFGCSKLTLCISNKCASFFRAVRLGNNCKLKELEIIGDTSNVTSFNSAFNGKLSLERIIGEIDFSSSTNNGSMFTNCTNLKHFTPKANTIKASISFADSADLTDESIDAIVNGFADMTGQTAPVLTVHPTVKAKFVADDEKDDTDPTKRFWLKTLTGNNVTLA